MNAKFFVIVAALVVLTSVVASCASAVSPTVEPSPTMKPTLQPEEVVYEGVTYRIEIQVLILEEGFHSPYCFWILDRTGICDSEKNPVPNDGIAHIIPRPEGWWYEHHEDLGGLRKRFAVRLCQDWWCGWYSPDQFRVLPVTPFPVFVAVPTPTATATPKPACFNYVVKIGDALEILAQKYGTTVAVLQADNTIAHKDKIYAGKILLICPNKK